MRKLILTALMIPFFVQADRPDVCLHVKETATLIMAARQSGMGLNMLLNQWVRVQKRSRSIGHTCI
jgi:hypothetical protein